MRLMRESETKRIVRGAVLLAIAIVATVLFSQTGQGAEKIAGTIQGNVSESGGGVVPNVVVMLLSPDTGIEQKRARADAAGTYALVNVPYGTYTLSASAPGYHAADPRLIILNSPVRTVDMALTRLDLSMGPQADDDAARQRDSKPPLSFSPAGIRGTIAPSGYSTGLSSEETARASRNVIAIGNDFLASLVTAADAPGCDREPDLLRAAQGKPHDFGSNRALGLFYLGHGKVDRSVQYLQAAHAAWPEEEKNSRDLAVALLAADRYSDAVAILEPLAHAQHKSPTTLKLLAMAYEGLGNAERSKSAYQEAAVVDPSIENQFDCGLGLIRLGATEEARGLFSASTSTHPESARLWMGLGIAEDLLEYKDSATRSLLRAVEKDPGYFPPYSFLADLSGSVSSADGEIRTRLAEFAATHPENAPAHFNYALAMWKQSGRDGNGKDLDEIVAQLKATLERAPELARAHFLLGEIDANRSDLSNAEVEFRNAVTLEPENAEAHYRLAQVYRREDRKELAAEEINRFRSLHAKPQETGISIKTSLHRSEFDQLQRNSPEGPCSPTGK